MQSLCDRSATEISSLKTEPLLFRKLENLMSAMLCSSARVNRKLKGDRAV